MARTVKKTGGTLRRAVAGAAKALPGRGGGSARATTTRPASKASTRSATKKTAKRSAAKPTKTPAKATPPKKKATTAAAKKAAIKKAPAKRAAVKRAAATTSGPAKTAAKKAPVKRSSTNASAKKAPARRAPAKKAPAKKASAKKAATKAAAKKAPATKAAIKKAAVKKAAVKKLPPQRPPAAAKAPAAKGPAKKAAPARKGAAGLAVRHDESPWTAKELGEVRAELAGEVSRLRSELDLAEHDIDDMLRDAGDGAGDDPADAGSKTFEREHEMSLANNTRDMLVQAERALARIENGTYGICENCGNPIGKARLQVFPRATLCMTCKQREERR